MNKYVGIYLATLEKLEEWNKASEEDMKDGMEKWNAWSEKHKESIVDMGAPLGKTKRVDASGVTDQTNEICGYTVVQADSHEAAAQIFTDNPHTQEDGAWIDVLEWVDMPES